MSQELLAKRVKANLGRAAGNATGYRADIDGLRAIAVLSVILFHAGAPGFSGGFVGVDVFFVISGYLITRIIHEGIESKTFSIGWFYERRMKRIFPALAAMSAISSLAALAFLMPFDLKDFGLNCLAAATSLSNIFLYRKAGYFDESSAVRPLLHTWSLAVEEQFYIVFPFIMLLLHKRAKERIPQILWILSCLSFAACVWQTKNEFNAAFYLPWFRAWELLIGSLLAVKAISVFASRRVNETLALLGFSGIALAVAFFSTDTQFPGGYALVPTLGAALIIISGEQAETVVSYVLGRKIPVAIGLISYSLYLWHWPILALTRYQLDDQAPSWLIGSEVLASIAIAYLSWKYLEIPARHARWERKRVFLAGVLSMAFLAAIGGILYLTKGLPQRFSNTVAAAAMVAFDSDSGQSQCGKQTPERVEAGDACRIGAPNAPITFALVGDSFAAALTSSVEKAAEEAGVRGYVLHRFGCTPVLGVRKINQPGQDSDCVKNTQAAFNLIEKTPSITNILVIARWSGFVEGRRFGENKNKDWFFADEETRNIGYDENPKVIQRGLVRTLAALSPRRVTMVAFIPEQARNIPRGVALARFWGKQEPLGVAREIHEARQHKTREIMNGIAKTFGDRVTILDIGKRLCTETLCPAMIDGVPIYSDDNHLSTHGGFYLKDLLRLGIESPTSLAPAQ